MILFVIIAQCLTGVLLTRDWYYYILFGGKITIVLLLLMMIVVIDIIINDDDMYWYWHWPVVHYDFTIPAKLIVKLWRACIIIII